MVRKRTRVSNRRDQLLLLAHGLFIVLLGLVDHGHGLRSPLTARVHFVPIEFNYSFVCTILPKPRDRPVSRSVITQAELTEPNAANSSRSCSSLALQGIFPT